MSPLRRAFVSVVSNISEGEAWHTHKEKQRFYEISQALLVEIDAQIEISLTLGFLKEQDILKLSELSNECFAMLSKLKNTR